MAIFVGSGLRMITPDDDSSPLAPLRLPIFRMLWFTWLMANVCMWMNDVAAAWLMTSIASKPIWVALVQTASTLPVFFLGLPSGAMADSFDKKRYFLFTQLWIALVSVILSGVIFFGQISPGILLALVFANGIGLALRWPVFSAILPELVPRHQLSAALGLNGVSMNASRIIGPIAAGALISFLGSAWVFLLNAMLSLMAAIIIARWRRVHKPHPLGREPLGTAMRVGVQYVAQSYHLKGVLLRVSIFFFHSTALMALLPLIAKNIEGGGAATFTLLLAAMGSGAIVSTMVMPQLRKRFGRDRLVLNGTVLLACSMVAMAWTSNFWIAMIAMLLCGTAWITSANTLSVSIQMGLPDWVRARGMSIYLIAIMGASALGAAFWGQTATWFNVTTALEISACAALGAIYLVNKLMPDKGLGDDHTPNQIFAAPVVRDLPPQGHVAVMIEYRIDPSRQVEFRDLMLSEGRRSRLRHGALSWELLHDIQEPSLYVEYFVEASWTDHLRRFERVTTADAELRDRKLLFHIGEFPPRITRSLMETTVKST